MQKNKFVMQGIQLWNYLNSKLYTWYNFKTKKQQRIILFLGIITFCTLVHFFILSPMHLWSRQQQFNFNYQLQTNQWIQSQSKDIERYQISKKRPKSQREIFALIKSSANSADVAITRAQTNLNNIEITVEDAAYQKLLKWLTTLESGHHLFFKKLHIVKSKEPGRVNCQMIIE